MIDYSALRHHRLGCPDCDFDAQAIAQQSKLDPEAPPKNRNKQSGTEVKPLLKNLRNLRTRDLCGAGCLCELASRSGYCKTVRLDNMSGKVDGRARLQA